MIDCPPSFNFCIEHQKSSTDIAVIQMPPCLGHWADLPEPIPAGRYGAIFTARVSQQGIVARVMRDGKTIATLKIGETRNWECREDADLTS